MTEEIIFFFFGLNCEDKGIISLMERSRMGCCKFFINIKDVSEEQKPYLEALKSPDKETVLFAIEVLKNVKK